MGLNLNIAMWSYDWFIVWKILIQKERLLQIANYSVIAIILPCCCYCCQWCCCSLALPSLLLLLLFILCCWIFCMGPPNPSFSSQPYVTTSYRIFVLKATLEVLIPSNILQRTSLFVVSIITANPLGIWMFRYIFHFVIHSEWKQWGCIFW